MKKFTGLFCVVMLSLLTLSGCKEQKSIDQSSPQALIPSTEEGKTIYISAAASLTETLTEIQTAYAKESKDRLEFNFGGSGALQKQITEGAPCDLFISAAKSNMEALEAAGDIDQDSRKNLLKNNLVLIAAMEKKEAVTGMEILTTEKVTSIAVGTPEAVPAGKYAQQALEKLELWAQIESKIVFAKDVRQVLSYVETGNADCGFVYESDTALMKTAVLVLRVPADLYDPIVYPLAIVKDSKEKAAAQRFCDYLQTESAKGVFEKYGFEVT